MDPHTAADPATEPIDPLDESYAPPPKEASLWEDFVDIFFSPAELYARRRESRWGKPMLALIVVSVLLYLAFFNANQRVLLASMEAGLAAGGGDAAQTAEMMNNPAARIGMTVFGALALPIMYLLMAAWGAVLLYGVGRLFDVRPTFRQAMVITTYALFVLLLSQLLTALLVTLKGDEPIVAVNELSFGVLRFLENPLEMNGALLALLQRLDLFALWQAALWGIALRAMLGASAGVSFGVAGVAWAVFALPQVLIGALTGGGAGAAGG